MKKRLSILSLSCFLSLSSMSSYSDEAKEIEIGGQSKQGLDVDVGKGNEAIPTQVKHSPYYLIGPGDSLNIFVWRNPELTYSVPVRPDGRISIPLVEDLGVVGKTPTELARKIEKKLSVYVKDPVVTVIVNSFAGPFDQQIKVVGEAGQPRALPYRARMTALDLMIMVGGLTEFAAGNRSILIRSIDGKQQKIRVRLDDLIKDGDINANIDLLPGDTLLIPESWF